MKTIIASMLLVFGIHAHASEILNARITKLMIDRGHGTNVFIKTDGVSNRTPNAGCHTNDKWDYIADFSDAYGKQIFSMLLAARASQQEMNLVGVNQSTCDLHPTVETLRRVEL